MNLESISASINSIVIEAGHYIRDQRKNFSYDKVSDKGLNQLVSYVDIETEKMLVEKLSKLLPEAGFITEENTSDIGRLTYNWIIDPLDGTTNFIHNVPVYSVSVGLAHIQEIVAGAVYEIGRDELFTAYKGGGTWMNGERIQVSEATALKDALMATGFPYYDFEQMEEYLSVLRYLMQETHGLRRMGSAAVDLAYVACGRFEGFFEYGLNSWDVAAGILLVKEAGGRISDFKGKEDYLFGQSIVASNEQLHQDIMSIINKNFN
ncbi:MAG: inositol monophosphatase [Bacteroidia bacterium]|nr:inositol monophosphatase [Bacteroidia bacterium]